MELVPVTARRAKRENRGLGQGPPGSTMTYCQVTHGSDGAVPVTAPRAKRENGGLGEDPPGKYDDLLAGGSDLE